VVITRRGRLAAPALALLVVTGTWLGHGVEYVRVAPMVGLGDALLGPLHRPYMLPLGAVLVALAVACGGRWLEVWAALGRRLDAARAHLAAVLRGTNRGFNPPATAAPTWGARFGVLAAALTVAQTILYTVQENVEAWVAGAPLPGLGTVVGRHWAAPLVQLGVAVALAGLVVLLQRLLSRRATLITRCERLLATLLGWLAPREIAPRTGAWAPAPVERHSTHLWRRPPPSA